MDLSHLMRLAVAAVLVLAGCSDEVPTRTASGERAAPPAAGGIGGACYPNGTCDIGLECVVGYCDAVTSPDLQPSFYAIPSMVTFPAVAGARMQAINITNEGRATLVVSKMEIIGSDSGMFSFGSGAEPFNLLTFDGSPNTRHKVEVIFTRPERDTNGHEAVLRIETNQSIQSGRAFDGVFQIALKAPASNGRLYATPNPIIFGRVAPPNCVEVVETLQAIGTSQTITDLTLAAPGVYTIIPDGGDALPSAETPWALAANETKTFTVKYCPDDERNDVGAINLTTLESPDADTVIDLKGNGGVPCISVSPDTGDFGQVVMNRIPGRLTLTVTNCSELGNGENLDISALTISADNGTAADPIFALDAPPATPLSLSPGASAEVVATCRPTVEGRPETGKVVISSNDSAYLEYELPLTCVGTTNECPTIAAVSCVERGAGGAMPSDDLLVPPLANLDCVADCVDPDGSCVNYTWRIISRPAESVSEFTPASSASSSFFVDANGDYEVQVDAQDNRGLSASSAGCRSTATLNVRAVPDAAFHSQLTWSTPSDPDSTDEGNGAGADLDLHVLNPLGCWEDREWDCHFRTPTADWGAAGFTGDDCSMDRDDTDGWGPENVSVDDPAAGTFKVGVHYWSDHGYGVSYATVIITLDAIVAYEVRDKALPTTGTWWEVCAVSWPSRNVVPVDRITSTVPVCL
jgi:hypothetical protein